MHILALPDELVLLILSHISSPASLVALQRSCARMRRLGRDSGLWRGLCLDALRDGGGEEGGLARRASLAPAPWHERDEDDEKEEVVDWYTEYTHRHAPLSLSWLDPVRRGAEALGMGVLSGQRHVLAPLDDGGVCIWDVQRSSSGGGQIVAYSPRRVLPRSTAAADEALDNVVVEKGGERVFISSGGVLTALDVRTLGVVDRREFDEGIAAVSDLGHGGLVVGTASRLHVVDARAPPQQQQQQQTAQLAQPGPVALLSTATSLYAAGRFPSILHYDVRAFPRLASTFFSGARISRLALAERGRVLVAAGGYKGKGSLEVYPLDANGTREPFRNRQTVAPSRILGLVPHGVRLLLADGDGNLKWMERDARGTVRHASLAMLDQSSYSRAGQRRARVRGAQHPYAGSSSSSSASASASDSSDDGGGAAGHDVDVAVRLATLRGDRDQVLLQTGSGRMGVVGFGRGDPLRLAEHAQQPVADDDDDDSEERMRRRYAASMRKALESQGRNVWWLRGLGL